jgi:hypothetical protein
MVRMRRHAPSRSLTTLALASVLLGLGCGGGEAPPDATAPRDALAIDVLATEDAGALEADAPTLDAMPEDAALDATVSLDGGAQDAARADVGASLDASDAGSPASSCEAAGGRCAVVPGACAMGIVGNADWYSCGGGLGVMCCLPRTTAPVCRATGTAEEGWYGPDGALVCRATCAGATLTCENAGTRSEGWYASPPSAACGTIPVDGLVAWTDCTP